MAKQVSSKITVGTFPIQLCVGMFLLLFGYLSYLLKVERRGEILDFQNAGIVFASIGALFVLSSISHGTFPGKENIPLRRRNYMNMGLNLLIYMPIVVWFLGDTQGFLDVLSMPFADKTLNQPHEVSIALGRIFTELGDFLRFKETVDANGNVAYDAVEINGHVKWAYVFLFCNMVKCGWKVLCSYGWLFLLFSGLTITAVIYFWRTLSLHEIQWNALKVAAILLFLGITVIIVIKDRKKVKEYDSAN